MSCLTSNANLKTALICHHYKDYEIDDISVMFKIAFTFAKKGFTPYIITKFRNKPILGIQRYLSYPEILNRIIFRYPESFQDIISWSHEIINSPKKTLVLLLFLDHFTKADDFEILNLCGALINSLSNLSRFDEAKKFYFLATVTLSLDAYLPKLLTLFHFCWLYKIINSNLSLKPFVKNDDPSNKEHLIRIDSLANFDNAEKLFAGYPVKTC